jgi:pimeloyl-ACP methyl ester carboxylesterase
MSSSPALGEVREVDLPAGTIRYRERGSGQPIVFLHGIVANGDLWRGVSPRLAGAYRCIVPDWPLGSHELGLHGGADLSLPGIADLVGEFFAALELQDVTLVANDTGGAVAQWVAIRHSQRMGRLVLTPGDAFENFLPPVLRHLQLFGRRPAGLWLVGQTLRFRVIQQLPIAFGRLTVRPIDRWVMDSYTRPLRTSSAVRRDFAALVRTISSRYTMEAAQRLPAFTKPALVVWSLDDRLFPLAHGRRLAKLLPQGRLEVIDDAGAFIPEDQPEQLAALIDGFIGETVTKPQPPNGVTAWGVGHGET